MAALSRALDLPVANPLCLGPRATGRVYPINRILAALGLTSLTVGRGLPDILVHLHAVEKMSVIGEQNKTSLIRQGGLSWSLLARFPGVREGGIPFDLLLMRKATMAACHKTSLMNLDPGVYMGRHSRVSGDRPYEVLPLGVQLKGR